MTLLNPPKKKRTEPITALVLRLTAYSSTNPPCAQIVCKYCTDSFVLSFKYGNKNMRKSAVYNCFVITHLLSTLLIFVWITWVVNKEEARNRHIFIIGSKFSKQGWVEATNNQYGEFCVQSEFYSIFHPLNSKNMDDRYFDSYIVR